MAATTAAIGRSLLTFRSSSSYLIMSKRLFSSSSSIARVPPLPGFSRPVRSTVSLSHSLRVFAPGAVRLNLIRCRVNRSGGAYSPLNSGSNFSDRPPTEMAPLFPGCDYEHWLIVMDKPGGEGATKQQMIDCYVETLAKVLGSEEEAKKKIYNVSCERYFGFGCEIDEETSNKLEVSMAMATKIARSLLTVRSSSSVPTPGFSRLSVSSFSDSLAAINLLRSPAPVNVIPPLFRGLDVHTRFFSSGVNIQKMKFPKYRKGRIEGVRDGGNEICFGKYSLQALEPARITSKQIEAGRRALQLNVRRGGKGGKVWVRIFPYKSVTSKPAETRMGRGKGAIAYWVAPVKRGQILYEMGGVTESLAKKAIQIAGSKMPIQTRSIIRDPKTKEIGIR